MVGNYAYVVDVMGGFFVLWLKSAAAQLGQASGQVRDTISGIGIAVVNIEVRGLTSASATIGPSRNYNLSFPVGTYTFSVSVPDYQTQTEACVEVAAGQATWLDFDLDPQPHFSITGSSLFGVGSGVA